MHLLGFGSAGLFEWICFLTKFQKDTMSKMLGVVFDEKTKAFEVLRTLLIVIDCWLGSGPPEKHG